MKKNKSINRRVKYISLGMLAAVLFGILVMSGCMQQALELPPADFLLKLYKSDSATAKSVAYTDHSLNISGSAKAVLKYVFKNNRIELQMGIEPGSNVEAHLKAVLTFKNTSDPVLAAGIYRFPEDSTRLGIVLSEHGHSILTSYKEILDGIVEVSYDTSRQTFSGTFRYLQFKPLPGKGFDRLNFTGWFNDALLEY